MNSAEPEFLTSLISYIPELHPGNPAFSSIPYQYSTKASSSTLPIGVSSSLKQRSVSVQASLIEQSGSEVQNLRATKKFPSSSNLAHRESCKKSSQGLKHLTKLNNTTLPTANNKIESDPDVNNRVTYQRCKQLFGSLKKKKTVAFGSTVNISQTVEAEDRRKKRSPSGSVTNRKSFIKMAGENLNELSKKIDVFEKKIIELNEIIVDLQLKDSEKAEQILTLTEMIKKLMSAVFSKEEKEDARVARIHESLKSRHKDDSYLIYKEEEDAKNDKRYKLNNGRQRQYDDSSSDRYIVRDDWDIIKKKLEEDNEFRKYVDQGLMKFGGDKSLDIVAQRTPIKKTRNIRNDNSPVPVVKATRLMKKMTLQRIHRHPDSPPRSVALSYDTRMYLAKHGVISDNDDEKDECENLDDSSEEPRIYSVYQQGESKTYYPTNNKDMLAIKPLGKNKTCNFCTRCQCGTKADVPNVQEINNPVEDNQNMVRDKRRPVQPPNSLYHQGESMTYYSANIKYISPSIQQGRNDFGGDPRIKTGRYFKNNQNLEEVSGKHVRNIGFQPDDFENDFEEYVERLDRSGDESEVENMQPADCEFPVNRRINDFESSRNRNYRGHFGT